MEDHNTDDHACNRFQSTEDGCAFSTDEEGALLEQNNGAGRNQQGKQNAKSPAGKGSGKNKIVRGNADAECADRTHQDHIEGEQKTGKLGTVKTGEEDHIRGKGDSGKQRQDATREVESFVG